MGDRVKVLYIAGSGRNGSTLLAQVLGELDGVVNVGEMARYLFNLRMRSRDLLCGCGQPVRQCAFWGDLLPVVDEETLRFADRIASVRNFPLLVFFSRYKRSKLFESVLRIYASLYGEIASRTGCEIVVDMSKHPANAYLLKQVPGVELYLLHLVRDVRGVVDSWSKPKGYLRRRPAWKSVPQWIAYNVLAESLSLGGTPYLRVLYEDFVQSPAHVLKEIAAFVGWCRSDEIRILKGNQVELSSEQHPLAGNPGKLSQKGLVSIQEHKWHLPLWEEVAIVAATWPWLVRYGYVWNRRHNVEESE